MSSQLKARNIARAHFHSNNGTNTGYLTADGVHNGGVATGSAWYDWKHDGLLFLIADSRYSDRFVMLQRVFKGLGSPVD